MEAPQTDIDIAEEIRQLNKNIRLTVDFLDDIQLSEVDRQIQAAVQSELVSNFEDAINSIEEYYNYDPLIEHLMQMVRWGPHVQVYNGEIVQIWDLEYAGSYTDLRAGQVAAGADFGKSPTKRSIGWKIIYDAAIHGIDASKYWKAVDDNTYAEIINSRLAFWGDKAPYWIFIEWGTNAGDGPGTPYPSFSGRNPIYRTTVTADRIAHEIIELYAETIEDTVITIADERFVDHDVAPYEMRREISARWTVAFQQYGKWIQREYLSVGGGFTGRWREVAGPD